MISFLEIVHLKGCLGGISQNSNFRTELRFDIFRHWLLSFNECTLYCTVFLKPTIGMFHKKSVERFTVEREVDGLITVTLLILKTTKQ